MSGVEATFDNAFRAARNSEPADRNVVQTVESLHEAWLEVEGLVCVFDALTDTLDPCGPGCREVTAISYTMSRLSKAFSRRMADTVIACGGKA